MPKGVLLKIFSAKVTSYLGNAVLYSLRLVVMS